ncbi:MAG TPA: hypothetical protein VGD72_02105 [Mycobacteriales bacterium]|jgi:hypothetical protein
MRDDEDDDEWALDQELEVVAEVYRPEVRTRLHELSDEELLARYRALLGFHVEWE